MDEPHIPYLIPPKEIKRKANNNIYYFDGFLQGRNSITKAGGYTVFKNGKLLAHEFRGREDGPFTNNEAELLGCLHACQVAEPESEIITDSMNTIAWVRRGRSKARPDLNDIMYECNKLVREKNLDLYWLPRDQNLAGHYNEFGEI